MDRYRELRDRLQGLHRTPTGILVGKVVRVNGLEVEVAMGNTRVSARLRPTALPNDAQLLITPAVDSAVVLGSLSGDLTELMVLAVDKADRIEMTGEVVINGGGKGGLVNVENLTNKLNKLVQVFNTHTHIASGGSATTVPSSVLDTFRRGDYEDTQVKH